MRHGIPGKVLVVEQERMALDAMLLIRDGLHVPSTRIWHMAGLAVVSQKDRLSMLILDPFGTQMCGMVELDVPAVAPFGGRGLTRFLIVRSGTCREHIQEPSLIRTFLRGLFQQCIEFGAGDQIRRRCIRLQTQAEIKFGVPIGTAEAADRVCEQRGRLVRRLEFSVAADAMLVGHAGELQFAAVLTMTLGTRQGRMGRDLAMVVFGRRMALQVVTIFLL